MEVTPVEIPTWIDILAVFVAGVAGSIIAARHDFDVTGVIFLAVISGLGGGIIRDTLLQTGTPVAFTNSNYLIAAFCAAGIGMLFAQRLSNVDWVFALFSALSLGLYTLVGVLKGLDAGLPTLSVLMLGILTAAGGGILLDILLTRTPTAFQPGAPYALLSLLGGIMIVIIDELDASTEWLWWVPVGLLVLLRLAALQLGWTTPLATDVAGQVQNIPTTAMRGMAPSRVVPRFRRSRINMPPPPNEAPPED